MESLNGSPFFVLLPAWASMAFAIPNVTDRESVTAAGGHSQCGLPTHLTQLHSVFAAGGNNMAPPMSHLTQFSLISRQVVHSLHHLTWIRGIFAAGGHSQCGLTTHMTQLQYFSAAGGYNMAPTISHLTQLSQISRQVVHSLHHLTWIRGVSAAGSAFIASPDMDSRHFRGRWAFSQRADGPPDTATIRFRGRWVQYGTLDVPPDTIIADFAAGSAFVASPGMDSRRFRGRWEDSMKQLIHNILIKRLIVAKEGIYCFLAGKYRRPRTQIYTAVVKTEDAGWLCTIRNLFKGIGNELLPSMHGRIGGNGNVQGQ